MTDPMTTAHVRLMQVGGRELRVATWRLDMPSDHLPVLFFNGIGANIEAVAPLAEALDDRGFVMFDMPGVGGSPEPTLPYTPVTMSRTAAKLLDQLGMDEVDVMGVSWGGAMAQHFALQHGGRVRRLILCATTAGMLMVPGSPAALSKMVDPRRYVDAAFMEKHFATLYGDALGKTAGKSSHIGRLTPPTRRGYIYQLLAMVGWTSAPALPFLRKPTLIMMGDEDAIVPLINGRFLHALIRGSDLEIFEGGGHLFLLSHREQSVSCIRTFLDRPLLEEHGHEENRQAA
ncbi:alpha/beta fold hydrolase [Parafrankia sp. BMG5.11]|uniref:alpha/beta fold hydrolase n=1 Tax=Parafrankia sp. BMG5.11 TaxID=222540 RepID=UPI001A9E87AB|nr:alpha/beta hydrolase [Parafrankia sp. BMG5.11]